MKNSTNFITGLLSANDSAPEQLLQYLCTIQQHFSYIPEDAIEQLASSLNIPATQISGVIEFYAFLHSKARGDFDIYFSDSITDHMLGSLSLLNSLCKKLKVEAGETRADGRVTIDTTSCTGICDQGPALLVNGMVTSRLNKERIETIAELIEAGIPISDWPTAYFEVNDNIQRSDILLTDKIINGSVIDTLIKDGSDAVLKKIELSGLRGRGGAGFSTSSKWQFCRDTQADEHYVVCNADEGEPGTFKDRVLLNSYADNVFEGMTLCAGVINAKKGYLYLRGEYRYLLEVLQQKLQQRRDANLLGNSIAGKEGFDFDIEIHLGAGAYICGEESALIESLEGKRGIPRKRPPFPVSKGYCNQPTVVNNVETFVAAAKIAVFGAHWYSSTGTAKSTGTKLLSISGDCARPGIYEYPFGVSIRQVLEDCGAENTQAVQVAGAAGSTIPVQDFDRKIAFEDISTGGSFMVFNQQRELLEMVQNFTHFFCHESCGFCTPCRIGSALMKNLVDKVIVGHATRSDLLEMENIGHIMQHSSHCGLGTTAPNPVLDTLKKFPEIYTKRLANRGFEPAFDLDAAVEESRKITGRDDAEAYIHYEPLLDNSIKDKS